MVSHEGAPLPRPPAHPTCWPLRRCEQAIIALCIPVQRLHQRVAAGGRLACLCARSLAGLPHGGLRGGRAAARAAACLLLLVLLLRDEFMHTFDVRQRGGQLGPEAGLCQVTADAGGDRHALRDLAASHCLPGQPDRARSAMGCGAGAWVTCSPCSAARGLACVYAVHSSGCSSLPCTRRAATRRSSHTKSPSKAADAGVPAGSAGRRQPGQFAQSVNACL